MPAKSSGILQLQDQRNILLGPGKVEYGSPLQNLGQVKGDVEFNYVVTPYDVKAGLPLQLLRRFVLGEDVNLTAPLLEITGNIIALATRNAFPAVGDTTTSPGGTIYHNTFGGSISLTRKPMRFTHPTPEVSTGGLQGYVIIFGYQVYPPLELRVPFAEQRESIYNANFVFSPDITRAAGDQTGYVDVFQVVDAG